ncbi:MAG: TonB-dependent receptor [Bacteroidales bacterium]|nr:TonB-dependent receptor [Bacteroidales bacterium]
MKGLFSAALALTFCMAMAAQTHTITGVVVDRAGEPVIGASILELSVSPTNGTVSDIDGTFSLSVRAGATIEVSSIGYVTRDIAVGDRTTFDVVLDDDTQLLDEVVVVGYGTQKKSDLTGALSVVEAKDLKDRTSLDVAHMLQGTIPGLNISSPTGRPGQAADINIRGWNSINGGSPLVLVDGVEGNLQQVSATDIESITVIKDAAAAAVYGARASFGVILVTTRNGNAGDGKPTLSYSGRFGFTAPTTSTEYETRGYFSALVNNKFFSTYDPAGYVHYSDADMEELWARRNDVVENPDRPWTVISVENGKKVYNYYANTDWYHYLYRDLKPTQSHSVTLSGGAEKFKYLLSGSYNQEQGMFRENPDVYNKYNLRSKLSLDVTKWLNINNNTSFFTSNYSYPGASGANSTFDKMHNHALACFPTHNPDGTEIYTSKYNTYTLMDGYHMAVNNPNFNNTEKITTVSNTVELTIHPIKQLELKGNYTYTFYHLAATNRSVNASYSETPDKILTLSTGIFENKLSEKANTHNYHSVNLYGTYSDTFAEAHNLKVMAGFNYETKHLKDIGARGWYLISETLDDLSLTGIDENGDRRTEVSGGQNEYAVAGFFGRVNYDYKGKYLLEVSGRYDGSSRFAQASRWGFFPSGSLGWKISEEDFFSPAKDVMNLLKLRYSFGRLGNQQVGYYDYLRTVTIGTQTYLFGGMKPISASISAPNSTDLTWETISQHNVGVDMALLDNRLTFTGEAYIRDTKDMLTAGIALPAIYGADSPKMNAADLRTKGYELSVNWRDQFTIGQHQFEYNIGVNFNDYVSHITRFDNPEKAFAKNYWEGMQYGEIWGYHIEGLFASDAEAASRPVDQAIVNKIIRDSSGEKGLRAGDLMFADLNGNGRIDVGANTVNDSGDRRIIGNSQPRYVFGINLGAKYFGFDLSIFLQGVGRQDWYPSSEASSFWFTYNRPYATLIPKNFLDDCWSEENPGAYYPRPRGYVALSEDRELGAVNDRYLQNIAYCRLKNVTFGYTIPEKLLSRVKIKNLRVYFSGENLAYIAPGLHSKYIDPEQASAAAAALVTTANGRSSSEAARLRTYPWQKTIMFGIDLSF